MFFTPQHAFGGHKPAGRASDSRVEGRMLIRQTFLYLPAQLIGPALQFVATVVWTHWLAPDDYGVLLFLIASQELVFVICLSWWSHYTMRYIGALDEDIRRRYLASEGSVLALASVVQAILAILVLASLSAGMTAGLIGATLLYTLTRSAIAHLSERARAASRIELYTFAQTFGPMFGFGLSYLAVVYVAPTAEMALLGFAIAQTFALLWLMRRMHFSFGRWDLDQHMFRHALRFGVPLVIAGIVGWISTNGIRVIIDSRMGAEAMGLLSVGWSLGQRLAVTAAMLVTAAAFPLVVQRLHEGSREGSLQQLANSGALIFSLMLPMAVGTLLISNDLVSVLIAPAFQALTLTILPVAVIAGACRNLRLHFSDQAFLLFERTDLSTLVNTVEAVAVVVFSLIGIALGGAVGAAEGCLLGSFLAMIGGMALSRLYFGLIIPWTHFARIALATVAMAVAVLLTPASARASIPSLVLKVSDGFIAYAITLAALYPVVWRNWRRFRLSRGAVT